MNRVGAARPARVRANRVAQPSPAVSRALEQHVSRSNPARNYGSMPSSRAAFSRKIFGFTASENPAVSKSRSQRSGVIAG